MPAKLLDGKQIAGDFLKQAKPGAELTLATIQVGEAKDVLLYAAYLTKLLKKLGVKHEELRFSEKVGEEELIGKIRELNKNPKVTGIMIFAPLPKHLNPANIFDNLSAKKDVEGRTFLKSHFGVLSPTAHAVMTLLEATGVSLSGKEAVVIGHSDLVGKPVAVLLLDEFATVTVCHAKTQDLEKHVQKADIVVAAVGKPGVIKGEWIKKGAIVIDVGENSVNGKIVGDVEFARAFDRAAFITPVPGGVGPVTNVMLLKNLIRLHEYFSQPR